MAKNYYLILGIAPSAAFPEIRAAYLRRVKQFHPDRFGPDTQPFHDVHEAYSILSDPHKRREYDDSLSLHKAYRQPEREPEPLIPRKGAEERRSERPAPIDLGSASLTRSFGTYRPSFDEIFDRLWRNFSRLHVPKSDRVRSLTTEIVLTPEEALAGGHVRVLVPAQARCPTCGGHGGIGFYECWRCAGQGIISGEYPVYVSYPPGLLGSHDVEISLDRFGISNYYMRVRFRTSETRNA